MRGRLVLPTLFLFAPSAALPREPSPATVVIQPVFVKLADGRDVVAEEGFVFVPENRARQESRTIPVHFLRIRAPEERRQRLPVFYLPGGPGSSVSSGDLGGPWMVNELAWAADAGDFVVVNQRGNPWVPGQPDLRWPLPRRPLDRPGSSADDKVILRKAVEEGLSKWSAAGVDLAGYDILNAVEDVNDVREALGYEKIVLRGTSFGSQWSFSFLKRHAEVVDRAILAGIEPLDYAYDSPRWVWNAFERLSILASEDAHLAPLLPEKGILGAYEEVLARLEARPLTVRIENPKSGDEVAISIGAHDLREVMMYPRPSGSLRENLTSWPRFVLELHRGDFRMLGALVREMRTEVDEEPMIGLLIDNSLGITKTRDQALLAENEARFVGTLNAGYVDTREITPTPDAGDSFRADWTISTPVLLIQGDCDLSTPLENAQHARRFLERGHLLVLAGCGTHSADNELYEFHPETTAGIRRFVAGESGSDLFAGIPERVTLPPLEFELPVGPSLYDEWLASERKSDR